MKQLITFLCAVILLTGCAAKGKFALEPLPEQQEKRRGSLVALATLISDERNNENRIDEYYDGDLIKDIQLLLERELLSTSLFSVVSILPEANHTADVQIETSLKRLEWGVPEYNSLRTKAFMVGLFTGVIGGEIYANTDTDVYGDSSIYFKVIAKPAGKVLLEKTYDAHYEERMKKLHCDKPSIKVDMVNKSLKKAIHAMKADLTALLGGTVELTLLEEGKPITK